MSTTVIEPSSTQGDNVLARVILAGALQKRNIVTNLGVVVDVKRAGVFVIAAIRGTVWSLATGTGDLVTRDVVWHETNEVSVDIV